MKKNTVFIILVILSGVATTSTYSMFQLVKPVRKPVTKPARKPVINFWSNFDAFTRAHPYKLSKTGVETSSAWRRAAVRAARKDNSNIRFIAHHIALFVERAATQLFYNENRTVYKESEEVALRNATLDAQDLAQHEELTILIEYDPTFEYETSSEYSESL